LQEQEINMIIGINASRARSGGAVAHLIGLVNNISISHLPPKSKIHIWGYGTLLDKLPSKPWLIKHSPLMLEKSIIYQLYWERYLFPRLLNKQNVDILLNVDAGSVCRFKPSITMSRDMLSYEPGEIERFGFSKARLRLWLLRHIQNASLQHANGAIFLTQYASNVIQASCGNLPHIAVIPHGVGENFRGLKKEPYSSKKTVNCIYVSNAAPYKHQWMVVKAVAKLRNEGYDIKLTLIGGGKGKAQNRLMLEIQQSDPEGSFVKQEEFVPHSQLPEYLARADIYLFASSCENMPNTLVEGMAAGLPIACSNRGPMPEVLRDSGVYFDPENPDSIAQSLRVLLNSEEERQKYGHKAAKYAREYSWERCAHETLNFIFDTYKRLP
jgi:glycosyltransferase involved in cell wall biosynthesis